MTSLTINSGNAFELAGNNFDFSSATSIDNSGTFRMQGGETLTNVDDPDINSGTVEYVGAGGSGTYSIQDFGAADYFDLTVNGTATETFNITDTNTLNVSGKIPATSGPTS